MGDVFDAMNRGKRQSGGEGSPVGDAAATPLGAAGDESPALPLERVEAEPIARPESKPARERASAAAPVSAAAERAKAQTATAAVLPLGHHDPALNGYAAEVVVHHDRGSVITEQYRAIRTQILARSRNRRLQTHVVTSSAPGEGKSVTTINLGIAFSELRSQKTLMIEADLRRPSFHKLFDRKISPGLYQLLHGDITDIDQAIHPTVYDNLQIIPAGERDLIRSTELLSSPKMAQILDRLKDRYDHIFIDTPPVVTVTDACILGAMADETLLVVRLHATPTDVVDRAKRLLRASNCELAGVILTHMKYHIPRYLYRYV